MFEALQIAKEHARSAEVAHGENSSRFAAIAQANAAIAQAEAMIQIAAYLAQINSRLEVHALFEEDARNEETAHWDTPGGY